MKISDKLGELNYDRNHCGVTFNSDNSRQAVYTFSGDVYKGLDVYSQVQTNQISYKTRLEFFLGNMVTSL